jgi:N-acetylglucosamine malate deacetylase 1
VGVTRRDVLLGAGGLASALAFGVPVAGAMAEARKLKLMVAGGHPGDPEYGCGGTVVRLTNLGHQVVLLYLNDGAWPPTDAATRTAEAKKACEVLKATPAYAGQTNGDAIVDNLHYEDYAKRIEAEKPDAVLTQ